MTRLPRGIQLCECRPFAVGTVLGARDDHGDGSSAARQLDVASRLDGIENRGEIRASLSDRVPLHPWNVHLDVHLRYRELGASVQLARTVVNRPHSRSQPYAVPD